MLIRGVSGHCEGCAKPRLGLWWLDEVTASKWYSDLFLAATGAARRRNKSSARRAPPPRLPIVLSLHQKFRAPSTHHARAPLQLHNGSRRAEEVRRAPRDHSSAQQLTACSRTKISADPNNTHWSKSTDRFGHKILLKQGWTPGSFLGAKDAKHASHYTAANASHIRVAVKDDTLGLGAKRGKAENETFGLSAFQGLLGRLNGKSDGELKKEESAQRDLKLQVYTNQRWGGIRFVSGGLLVGDKIEKLVNKDSTAPTESAKRTVAEVENPSPDAAKKKRKRSEDDESESLKGKKRKSGFKKDPDQSSQDGNEREKTKSKKSKKSNGERPSTGNASAEEKEDEGKLDKKARKEAKKARKLERLAKKEAKESKRADKEKQKQKKAKKTAPSKDNSSSEDESTPSANTSAPASGTSTPIAGFAGGRLAVRQRYIAQKKRASMDPQALREIFMIKSEA